jgi:basic membrane lipoprotein Med (substrate-binding protein (PBP1-ABC) superfamily)
VRRVAVAVSVVAIAAALGGCGSSAGDDFADSLEKAGFTNVEVHQDKETKSVYNKKKKKNEKKSVVVGYDFDWKANTDSDPATCDVELEHAASSSGSLTGNGWYIDEVNGKDVTDSPPSPNPDAVRNYLTSHQMDC